MNIEEFYGFCLQLPFVTEGFPFGGDTLVFKVKNKMFALTGVDTFDSINLKCNPEKAIQLREQYSCVIPGYHMSKAHWNSVMIDGSISDKFIKQWILDSYALVAASLPKAERFDVAAAVASIPI
jgi:predicted DNA-binding protein (MmcQ/YjbR family)